MADRRRAPVSMVTTSPTLHTDYVGTLAKGSRLSVTVVEALRDLVVVSLDHNSKVYQGALLDITNRSIKPFCTSPFPKTEDSAEDEAMFALKMRHTYVVSSRENEAPFNGGSAGQGTGKPIEPVRDKRTPRTKIDQHVRMRKLRPRQTLCSNCQSRCDDASSTGSTSRGSAKKNTAPLVSVVRGTREASRTTAPLEAAPQTSPSGSEAAQPPVPTQTSPSPWTEEAHPQADIYASVAENSLIKEELPSSAQMPESEDQQQQQQRQQRQAPPINQYHKQQPTAQDQLAVPQPMGLRKRRSSIMLTPKTPDERRTTRADMKAQQTQQQQLTTTAEHHHPTPQQSPVIKISFNNPQGKGTVVKIPAKVAVADYEETTSDDEEKDDFAAVAEDSGPSAGVPEGGHGSIEGRAKRHRRDGPTIGPTKSVEDRRTVDTPPVKHHKHKAGKHKRKRHKTSGGPDSDGESVPNFPQAAVGGDDEEKEETAMARNDEPLRSGDIVWGKVMGFPWWPGRILSLHVDDETVKETDPNLQNGQAHVAWFGSSTSSRILTTSLAPFLRDFKLRYNRRKRGPYKEAIRQATQEAKAKSRTE